jgi:serine phosphatase RsbU (regulator of sigma subunit)
MRYLLVLLFIIFFTDNCLSQQTVFPVKNYTTKDYGSDFSPSNSSVLQDGRGIIYAGNGFKLLEFDGSSWSSYPINKKNWILSLATDKTGKIYAGSQGEFGCFTPDVTGALSYQSFSDSLEIENLDFSNIWRINTFSGGIAFQSEEKIFVYDKGKISVLKPKTSFHLSFAVNNELYVRERDNGLLKWQNGGLIHIAGSEIFDTTGIFMMVPFGKGGKEILAGTRGKGFLIFNSSAEMPVFRKFVPDNLNLIERSEITGGAVTKNGLIAVGTRLAGVFIIDTTGKTVSVMDERHGLSDNEIKQIIADNEGNVWVATNIGGISCIATSSPIYLYSDDSGIEGNVTSVLRYKSLLYAGTSRGLFRQSTAGITGPVFEPCQVPFSNVSCLAEVEGSLLAGTDEGLYDCSARMPVQLGNDPSYTLYYSKQLELLFSGGPKGLAVYSNKGKLRKINLLKDVTQDITGLSAEKSTGDTIIVWAGTRFNEVIRIRITADLFTETEYFGEAEGLPEGLINPFATDSGTVFGTINGLYRFIDEAEVKKSLPDSLKNNKEFLKGYFSNLNLPEEITSKELFTLHDEGSRMWICMGNKAGYLEKGNGMKYVHQPFAGIDVGRINSFYPESSGTCWIATTDGLIRYYGSTTERFDNDFFCLIRNVSLINTDSALFRGSFFNDQTGIEIVQPASAIPVIPFGKNSLRISFSAPFYEYPDKTLYSYQLNDSKWSQWNHEAFRDFTNMREGDYSFRIKAVNIYGKESKVAEYRFTVLPPWYRTIYAYLFSLIAGIITIWLIVRANSYRLKLENLRLEGIVRERTSEVVRQKEEIENKNEILQHQNKEIEDSIRYASRIQTAVIPPENMCQELFPHSFIFFRPLNIVSGDFYWFSRVGSKLIFTAVDCTGHGVPGAFMSMLGVAFLKEIVDKDHITEPDLILNHLRNKVVEALQHKGTAETRDGMDVSLVCIDTEKNTLEYAGAYNPLIIVRDNQVTTLDGDKMPVGIYEKMDPFKKHSLEIHTGDVFYLASDGYEDQFGGPDGKKLKSKKFKQMLLDIHHLPMNEQKEIIEKRFNEWKGELKQIDDVVVAGIKI